ncbi:MAG: gliding motility-associated C-terminal domain-containing protein, partial [Fulvivirga sp.]|uniref:T9SS type B sorting domain-containing protein n=1 Tax=Fulvivirga sp. TaxID=1931237 RepID=UPI0032F043E5
FKSIGTYNVTLSTKKGECSDSYSIAVNVVENTNLFIPNVFSPKSSNPENSTVKVYGEDLSNEGFEFFIYNRWGQVVYRTSNLDEAQSYGWNGETSGEEKGNSVFTYTVRGKYNNGNPFEETGTITLVK